MSEFVAVAKAEALVAGGSECVRVAGQEIALFRVGDEYFAIANECPHAGGPLCDGYLNDSTVMCPWHCWEFDVTNGACVTVAGFDVASYPVRVADGIVQLSLKP